MTDNTIRTDTHTPSVTQPDGAGVPGRENRNLADPERTSAPAAPKTSGASEKSEEPLKNPLADRNGEGARQAGMTPRPTDKPIAG